MHRLNLASWTREERSLHRFLRAPQRTRKIAETECLGPGMRPVGTPPPCPPRTGEGEISARKGEGDSLAACRGKSVWEPLTRNTPTLPSPHGGGGEMSRPRRGEEK